VVPTRSSPFFIISCNFDSAFADMVDRKRDNTINIFFTFAKSHFFFQMSHVILTHLIINLTLSTYKSYKRTKQEHYEINNTILFT